jgi:hypothetical protein
MKRILLFAFLFLALKSPAQIVNWSEDIAPIIYNNCSSCHRTGNIAPFVLESYGDAVSWASMIQSSVNSGYMPPWPADAAYARHANERLLTVGDIQKINDWVSGGTPLGDVSLAPNFPNFGNGSELSAVDYSAKMPNYSNVAIADDEYRCFVIPSGITTDKFIQELEIVPGNRGIVHHVLVFGDNSGEAATLDAADPAPGYPCYGDAGTSSANLLGLWAPGSVPQKLPNGFGIKLAANSDVILQVHYPSGSAGLLDSSRVNFKFASSTARETRLTPILNHSSTINTPLIIPANSTPTFTETYTVPLVNITVFAVAPHMHLIGQKIKTYAIKPAGDTLKLNKIDNWDFHWQGMYFYPNALKVPAGSTLKAEALYNNTTSNPLNPSNPPQLVTLGESTTDEMMLVYFLWTLYANGDESIVIDPVVPNLGTNIAALPSSLPLEVFPNPASKAVYFNLPKEIINYQLTITDAMGRICEQTDAINLGSGYRSISELSAGLYQIKIVSNSKTYVTKLMVNR